MFIYTIIMSVLMYFCGAFLKKFKSRGINSILGYRTKRSSINIKTWEYAQKESGKIMCILSIINFVIFIPVAVLTKKLDSNNTIFLVCAHLELVFMLITIPITEYKLKIFINQQS